VSLRGLPDPLPEAIEPPAFEPAPGPAVRWYHKAASVVFAIALFELGVLLVVFPWLDAWESNYFASLSPGWHALWLSMYFRGALSGIGVVNIYFSFAEVLRLRRFARPD